MRQLALWSQHPLHLLAKALEAGGSIRRERNTVHARASLLLRRWLYRQQADIVDTADEAKTLTAQADQWMQKTLDLKKKKTEGSAAPKAS